ncbi:MAG TPA: hypothetical protein PLB86_07325 [Dermatophilaceae bacterium]|nr:hypothetical protein [Dermatophilaceae bacterium]
MPAEVLPDLVPKIAAAAAIARDAEDGWRLAVRLRDQFILAAVDAGLSHREIAAAAGVTKSRIVGIILGAGA